MPSSSFGDRIPAYIERLEQALEARLPDPAVIPSRLHESMRYAALGGGKHLRPLLVYATGEVLGLDKRDLDSLASALELIHAYSLVHDDLPAMDDDDLRRGRPTCHKAYDEATAILCGDAMQALAFEVLAKDAMSRNETPETTAKLTLMLAQAIGSRGMAGGQALDIDATGKKLSAAELDELHIHKTGMLIRACVTMPCQLSPELSETDQQSLDHYAKCIGLAFQIWDDVLDETADAGTLGKNPGADRALDKPTYPSIHGLEESKARAQSLIDDAIASLGQFSDRAEPLIWIAQFIINRAH